MKKALITGITGQDGAYLAKHLTNIGYQVIGIVRNLYSYNTKGLSYLKIEKNVQIEECDLSDPLGIIKLIKKVEPDEIYHLASQSSVGRSFKEPISTLRYNTNSVLNILEALRITESSCKFYQASSSEMFGLINQLPISESSVMHPVSPYGISKATAFWTTVCYRESYGIYACNGILFNHESFLRGSNFFIKKVISTCIEIKLGNVKELVVGNLNVKRDFGYAPDYVVAMHKMMQLEVPEDIIICSGESVLLQDIVYYIFEYFGLDKELIIEDQKLFRPNEIQDIYGDDTKARKVLKWNYKRNYKELLGLLIEEELQFQNLEF